MNSTEPSAMSATILYIASQYSTYTNYIIFNAGIVGSIINLFIFTHLKLFRNNRCVFYLTMESICNIIYQLFSIITVISASLYGSDVIIKSLVWCRLIYTSGSSCGLITFSMICLAAADQFFSTNYRFNLRQMCTMGLAQYLAFLITAIWLIHGVVYAFFVNMVPFVGCIVTNPILIQYTTFFLYPVLASLLPVVIASLFSFLAFRNVRRIVRRQVPIERRRFDRQITAMVLFRVVFFVFSTIPFVIYRIYVINGTKMSRNTLAFGIVQLIQQIITSFYNLNYAANFYIFILLSSRYRRQVKYVLIKKCWQRWKCRCDVNRNEVHPENPVSIHSKNESK